MYVFLENKAFGAAWFFVTLPIPRKGDRPALTHTVTVIGYFLLSPRWLSSHCVGRVGQGGRPVLLGQGGTAEFLTWKEEREMVEGQGTLQCTRKNK